MSHCVDFLSVAVGAGHPGRVIFGVILFFNASFIRGSSAQGSTGPMKHLLWDLYSEQMVLAEPVLPYIEGTLMKLFYFLVLMESRFKPIFNSRCLGVLLWRWRPCRIHTYIFLKKLDRHFLVFNFHKSFFNLFLFPYC